mmetsp:Transcript_125348/g.360105  ORF Transcript_125348/g.360105 Transcript_125348/m.360105 type:complete len:296 (+) Transcript_125348:36-923(+)
MAVAQCVSSLRSSATVAAPLGGGASAMRRAAANAPWPPRRRRAFAAPPSLRAGSFALPHGLLGRSSTGGRTIGVVSELAARLRACHRVRAAASSADRGGGGGAEGRGGEQAGRDASDDELGPKAEDLYQVLGLRRGAEPEEIKAAYRRLAKQYHPDLNVGDPSAQARFREVSHAHATLLHVGLRRMYDLHLRRLEGLQRSEQQQEEERRNSLGAILLSRRWTMAAVAAAAGATAVALLCELALRSPGVFWASFRALPDATPGKWQLAEWFSSAAARRHGVGVGGCGGGGGGVVLE